MKNSAIQFIKFFIYLLPTFFSHSAFAQQIKYTNSNNGWNADSLGNHRAKIEFTGKGSLAKTIIYWRRHDKEVDQKRIIVQDATTGKKITNIKTLGLDRESGTVFFEPISGAGTYYIYYMPYKYEGPNTYYPKGKYYSPEQTASSLWLNNLPKDFAVNCTVSEIQSVNAFNSFYPMEVIATEKETTTLIQPYIKSPFILFLEKRQFSIKMKTDLPQRWILKGINSNFSDQAHKGEYFSFQIGVYALQHLKEVAIRFSNLKNERGNIILSNQLSCINTEGISYNGTPMKLSVSVEKGNIQALWCGLDIPKNASSGTYKGKVFITAEGITQEMNVSIKVDQIVVPNQGIDHPENMTRLKWLNSTLAQENDIIAPYTPLTILDTTISFLGRKISLNKDGFPAQIQTFFTPEMTSIVDKPTNLITEPLHFHIYDSNNKQSIKLKSQGIRFLKQEPGTVVWQATSNSSELEMEVTATLEFDGFLSYRVKYTALKDLKLNEITFHMPMQPQTAKYLMGLGLKGGDRPDSVLWKWDVAHKNQDGAWIGNVNAGIQFSFRDEKYTRPLNTNFYLQKPLLLPTSWGNEKKGGIDIYKKGNSVLVNAYSGPRNMKKGEILYYNFNLLITPFHPINTDFQWSSKFYHKYKAIDSIRLQTAASIVNIHHATPINPYINYPFIEFKKMKEYIDEAHEKQLKVKIYNTIRELSNKAYEIHALRSLGHEIFSSGKGGGFSWLQEHLGDDYIAAWFVPELKDAAIVNSGSNRWHNYYVEGMNWLVKNVGIDGIYLDDVAFDRITMKRIKRVLTQDGHPGILDLHSANQFNKNDGFNNSANLYMEHFPYLNKLWFGEYFDYENSQPDFFLTEISGIPFGLMGEMLQDGGNPWRGMIYGMTNRMPWSDNADPRPIWKLWDDFGMLGSSMIGYWSENCPVKTNNEKVLATAYVKKGAALISIASWDKVDTEITLTMDWKKLGIDPSKATIIAPAIKNMQTLQRFKLDEPIKVQKNKGILLIVN